MAEILGFGLWHLTAKGWIPGSWRYRDEGEEVPPPEGRVKTCRFMLTGSVGGDPREMLNKLWIGDPERAEVLERRFGRCPRSLPGPHGRPADSEPWAAYLANGGPGQPRERSPERKGPPRP